MNKVKSSVFFRVISLVLIFSFIALDISWAYPPGENTQNNNLAIWSNFQQSVFVKEAGSALVIRSIATNLFGDLEAGSVRLPLKGLAEIVAADLGKISGKAPGIKKALEIIDISHVTIAKCENGNFVESQLDKDKFVPDDAILLVPYRKDGMDRIIQIALKGSSNANALIGEDASFLLGERFVVRDVPKDWKGPAEAPAELKEAPEFTVSEPIGAIETPAAQVEAVKPHDFTAIAGFRAAVVTGSISLAGFATAAFRYSLEGNFQALRSRRRSPEHISPGQR